MAKVLVFGGAGYIGSHTCKCLAENGYEPVVFDNFTEGHRHFVKWGGLIEGDTTEREAVLRAVQQHAPVAIIHFAAFAYIGESVSEPAKYYDNNVTGSLNIAIAAQQAGNIPVIFSSSCATYGVPDVALINEDTEQRPINPYGRTKLVGEQILRDFSVAYGLGSVCLRYFNASGADADTEIGEAHRVETHLIPRAILSALGKIRGFSLFGTDYDTPDGSAIRDYVHVTDLAQAHVLACNYLLEGGETQQFNIGTGTGISVFEIIDAVASAAGKKVPVTLGPRRKGDPPRLVADTGKAARILGFRARHSDLENIIKTALKWHVEND